MALMGTGDLVAIIGDEILLVSGIRVMPGKNQYINKKTFASFAFICGPFILNNIFKPLKVKRKPAQVPVHSDQQEGRQIKRSDKKLNNQKYAWPVHHNQYDIT